ncbi:MAG TPA: sulfatase [Myxococcota bacterium]|nr:sulfatase [Myxococcota bacterium]
MISRRRFLQGLGAGAAAAALSSCFSKKRAPAGDRPNILFLTADDMGWDSPGCFGGLAPEITPHLDALAASGMRFARAHINISVCQPSRAVMMTGRYPHRNGVTGFRMGVAAGVPTLSELLVDAGYETALLGKEYHYLPREKYRWRMVVESRRLGGARDPAMFAAALRTVIRRAKEAGRPFFIHANSNDPHRPFYGGISARPVAPGPAPSRIYKAGEVKVPGFLPDLPEVRTEVAQYCSSVRRLDDAVGAVVDALAAEQVAEHTLVLFLSDNGMSFPFAKASCYFASTRTPLVAVWPGRIAAGAVDEAHLVSAVDLAPTLLEIAVPEVLDSGSLALDGRSLLPLFGGGTQPDRDEAIATFHTTSAGRSYEMRAVYHGRWAYIWNPWADGMTAFHSESQTGLSMRAMREAARSDPAIAERVQQFLFRAPEELYDFVTDPNSLVNLAADSEHASDLTMLRKRLANWLHRYEDPLEKSFASVAG